MSGFAYAAASRAAQQDMGGGADGKKCAVKVDRSQSDGTYDVTRQVLENGDCICFVYTGPRPQADTIERAITRLQEVRECPDAKVMMVPGAVAVGAGAGAGAAGGVGGAAIGVGAAAAAAALGVAASGGNDSPGG